MKDILGRETADDSHFFDPVPEQYVKVAFMVEVKCPNCDRSLWFLKPQESPAARTGHPIYGRCYCRVALMLPGGARFQNGEPQTLEIERADHSTQGEKVEALRQSFGVVRNRYGEGE